MRKTGAGHSVDAVFVLSLFCVFAAAVLMTLILGTKTHAAMETASDEAYYSRTAISYMTEKLRHADGAGGTDIGEFGGSPALFIYETYNGTEYETAIYCFEGDLCELFCEKGSDLGPSAGKDIIAASSVGFTFVTEKLIRIDYTDPDGNTASAYVSLRSGGEGQ